MKMIWQNLGGFVAVVTLIGLGLAQPFPALAMVNGSADASASPPRLNLTSGGTGASTTPGRRVDYTDRLIVKYSDKTLARATILSSDHVRALSSRAGVALTHLRAMSGSHHLFKLPNRMTNDEAQVIAQKLSADPSVEYAVPDRTMSTMQIPDDPDYGSQWDFKSPTADGEIAGINIPQAWDITTGSSSVVVGVIDTGIVNHADLQGRILPGYNFISDAARAGNGIGRSADASDLGDWVTSAESSDTTSEFYGCTVANSSWHGTHVTGTIAATANNGVGVAGINWNSKILPVRVLGKCGGYLSDVMDGMSWAAGLSVPGVPANTTPANVISMSLGGAGACDSATQSTINNVLAAGKVVVVAAGNDSIDPINYTPAGCTGVISVAAVNRSGGAAFYTNYGQTITIAAPGGDNLNAVLSTLNTGTTSPVASPGGDTYVGYYGTSMATPHVSGVVSLMLSLQPTLTPSQVVDILQATARPFPPPTGGDDCTTSICGAGMVDAYRAVQAAGSAAPVIIASPPLLNFTTRQGDPDPSSQSIAISNPGKGTLNWSVSSSAAWLHVSPSSGQGNGTVTVSIDNTGVYPGAATGSITISAPGAVISPVTIPVTVEFLLKLHTPIPVAVNGNAQAAVNGKVYVIGGWVGSNLSGLVQIYDTATDTWTTGAPKPTPTTYIYAAAINGKIYVPGGYNGDFNTADNLYNTFEIYDTATDSWSTGAPLPTPLSGAEVEAVNGKLYLLGGDAQGGVPYTSTYVYDPAANTWTSLGNSNTTGEDFGKGVINGKIYIFGGTQYGEGGSSSSADVYDPVANTWSTIGSLNTDRASNGGEALAGKLYAFGGESDRQIPLVRQDAEVYDPATDSWSFLPLLLNQPRFNLQATAVGNSIYVMGGTNLSGVVSNINESYDLGIPSAPVDVSATADNLLALVAFTAPVSNGGSPITGYTVTSYPAGGTDSNAGSLSTNHTITGLTAYTTYSFTVTATNAIGTGPASAASNSIIPSPVGLTGVTGPAGPADSLSIGAVTTGAAGSSPSLTLTGTSPSQVLNLTIPAGATGARGPAGSQGLQGPAGTSETQTSILTKLSTATSGAVLSLLQASGEAAGLPKLEVLDSTGTPHFVATAGGNVGFGTSNPLSPLHVVGTQITAYRGLTVAQQNDGPQAAIVVYMKSRGTQASPTAVQTGDNILAFQANPYDGVAWGDTTFTGSISFMVDGPVSPSTVPTAFIVGTGTNYSNKAERMRITSAGNVGIGTPTPAQALEVNGTAKVDGAFRINTTAAQPACTASTRGSLWVTQGAGSANDSVSVCVQYGGGVFTWKALF
jgi:serine protease